MGEDDVDVVILCEGERAHAREVLPGVWRCDRCGHRVKVGRAPAEVGRVGRRPDHDSSAEVAVSVVAGYLLKRGWYRDGDDPGVWIPPDRRPENGPARSGVGITDAFAQQLVADDVGWPSV